MEELAISGKAPSEMFGLSCHSGDSQFLRSQCFSPPPSRTGPAIPAGIFCADLREKTRIGLCVFIVGQAKDGLQTNPLKTRTKQVFRLFPYEETHQDNPLN